MEIQWINGGLRIHVRKFLLLAASIILLFQVPAFGQPASCYTPPSNIVAWWRAEGDFLDAVSNNFGAVTAGTVGFTNSEVGSGFYFDGGANRIEVPDAPSFDFGPGQDFSIEGWINASPNAGSGVISIIDKRLINSTNSGQGYEFGLYQNRLNLRLSDDPSTDGDSWNDGPILTDGQWHHIAVTVIRNSTTGGNFYVDGVSVLQFDPTSRQGDLTTSASFRIGNHSNPSYNAYFNGALDEFAVYNRALSPDKIAGIYNAGSAGKCVPPHPPYILNQTGDQSVMVSNTAIFMVAANGTLPLSYQWQCNQTNIPGGTNSELVLTNVQQGQAGDYSVIITNIVGSVTSTNAHLTVIVPQPCYAPPSGLLAWWRGEGNAADSFGTNNGAATGGLTYGSGEVGQGFIFDGSTGSVEIPANTNLNVGVGNGFTVEAWINPTSVALERPIVEWNKNGTALIFGYLHLVVTAPVVCMRI
jgi:hypothetical protein